MCDTVFLQSRHFPSHRSWRSPHQSGKGGSALQYIFASWCQAFCASNELVGCAALCNSPLCRLRVVCFVEGSSGPSNSSGGSNAAGDADAVLLGVGPCVRQRRKGQLLAADVGQRDRACITDTKRFQQRGHQHSWRRMLLLEGMSVCGMRCMQ